MVRVHLDPPSGRFVWGVCSLIRQDIGFDVLSRPTGRKLTSLRERNISIAWRSRVWGCLGFDPERRYCSKSSTLTNKHRRANQPAMWVSTAFDTRLLPRGPQPGRRVKALLFLDQIKREKGVWWMPWQQEAMKDVIPCVKPWGAGNRL
jgi:hypothetical protein